MFPLVLGAFFLPEVVAAGFHLFRGDSVQFRGWQVPVPAGWFALHRDDTLSIQRLERFYVRRAGPQIFVFPVELHNHQQIDPVAWRDSAIRLAASDGFKPAREQETRVDSEVARCIEFHRKDDPGQLWTICDLRQDNISFNFRGDRAFAPVFDRLLRGLKRLPKR